MSLGMLGAMKHDLHRNWGLMWCLPLAGLVLFACKRTEPPTSHKLSRITKAMTSVARRAAKARTTADADAEAPSRTAKCWDAEVVTAVGSAKAVRLVDGGAIRKELDGALQGKPRRITIDAHTGVKVLCDCPFFVVGADGYAFAHPSYKGDVGDAVAWAVSGTYRLTGYYSGRLINTYQLINERLEPGEQAIAEGSGDDEQRAYWPERHPELCIESWCFSPNADWKGDPRTENQPKELAEMRRLGGRLCK